MPWGYNKKGMTEIPANEVSLEYPDAEEAAHLPSAGFAGRSYSPDNKYVARADESGVWFRRN